MKYKIITAYIFSTHSNIQIRYSVCVYHTSGFPATVNPSVSEQINEIYGHDTVYVYVKK